MSGIAFVDDNKLLSKYYLQRNYNELSAQIKEKRAFLTDYIEFNESLVGFSIVHNEPLSELYQRDFFVVRFTFANIQVAHREIQEKKLIELMERLYSIIETRKGYYNLRLPSHIVDVLKAYNGVFQGGCFCGGTVEEVIAGRELVYNLDDRLKVFWANEDYIEKYREELLKITFESFKDYQGQYHISPVTQKQAAKIYENWINQSLKSFNHNIAVADYNDIPIGFITIDESEIAVEGLLNAVDENHRNLGAYRAMLAFVINDANRRGRNFVISTQLDNFIVQGIWGSMGLKPFYSIYNIHFDKGVGI